MWENENQLFLFNCNNEYNNNMQQQTTTTIASLVLNEYKIRKPNENIAKS